MGNVTYRSGDIARMLGISQEAIRYYEKQGIILSDKDEENGYRHFRFRKLIALAELRMFSRMGFSVQRAWQMVNGENIANVSARLAENEQDLTNQIERLTQIQEFSAQLRRDISQIPKNLNQLSLQQVPGFYHMKFQNNRQIIKDKQHEQSIKMWYESSPAVKAAVLCPLDACVPGFQVEIGFSVRQDFYERWLKQNSLAVQFIPGGRALCAVIAVESGCTDFYEPLRPILADLQASALPCQNLIHAIPLAIRCRLDDTQPMKDYYQVHILLADEPEERTSICGKEGRMQEKKQQR